MALVSGFILFASSGNLGRFGLDILSVDSRGIVSMLFFASALLTIISLVLLGVENAMGKYRERQDEMKRVNYLHNLDSSERNTLNQYINENKRKTLDYGSTNAGVMGLEKEGILIELDRGERTYNRTYKIDNWVWDYLHENPEILQQTIPRE